MMKVTVVYPNSSGSHFDIRYYCETHIPLVRRLLAPALQGAAVEHGIAGAASGSPAPYLAIGQLQFDFVEAFQSAFGPHSQEIMSGVRNYTNIQPVIQNQRSEALVRPGNPVKMPGASSPSTPRVRQNACTSRERR